MKPLHELIEKFSSCRILVIGDLMLDESLWGHIERISPEAPVPILRLERREFTLGGTGNVVKNLCALGARASIIGLVGDDETGQRIVELLDLKGAHSVGIVRDPQRKSTRKVRLMSIEHGQQVFRFDEEGSQAVCGAVEVQIINLIHEMAGEHQLILCSDYLKGVLTERVLKEAFAVGRNKRKTTVVGPKDSNYKKYMGADILMANLREFSQLVGTPADGIAWLTDSARRLTEIMGLEAVVVTRGKDGMTLFERVNGALRCLDISTAARNVYDVTGAGDTALAIFAAATACGADHESAAHLANAAAGVVVGKSGTATAAFEEIQAFLQGGKASPSFVRVETNAKC